MTLFAVDIFTFLKGSDESVLEVFLYTVEDKNILTKSLRVFDNTRDQKQCHNNTQNVHEPTVPSEFNMKNSLKLKYVHYITDIMSRRS